MTTSRHSLVVGYSLADATITCWIIVEIRSGLYLVQCSDGWVSTATGPSGLHPGSEVEIDRRQPGSLNPYSTITSTQGQSVSDWVRLEQKPYEELPAGGFTGWLEAEGKGLSLTTINQYWQEYQSVCNGDGSLDVEIYVYLSRPDLQYRLTASRGTLSQGQLETETKTEQINSGMDTGASLQYAPTGDVQAEWQGQVLDSEGSQTSQPPAITANAGNLSWDQQSLGAITATYQTARVVYLLSLPATTGDEAQTATVTATWGNGQFAQLTIAAPPKTGNCTGLNAITAFGPSGDDEDNEKCYRKIIVVDPCTGEQISERTEEVQCADSDADCWELRRVSQANPDGSFTTTTSRHKVDCPGTKDECFSRNISVDVNGVVTRDTRTSTDCGNI